VQSKSKQIFSAELSPFAAGGNGVVMVTVSEGTHRGMRPAGSIPATPRKTFKNGGNVSPIYQYRCDRCGWSIDINRTIAERDNAPMCGDCCVQMTRSISQVGAIFKGDGWGKSK